MPILGSLWHPAKIDEANIRNDYDIVSVCVDGDFQSPPNITDYSDWKRTFYIQQETK